MGCVVLRPIITYMERSLTGKNFALALPFSYLLVPSPTQSQQAHLDIQLYIQAYNLEG